MEETRGKQKKPFYKRIWVWVLGVFVALFVIGSLGEEEESSSGVDSDSGDNTTESSSDNSSNKDKEESTVGVGTPLKVEGIEFTVNGISTASNVGGQYGVNAQGTFLLVDVTVKNLGKEAITTDSSYFKLLFDDMEFEADSTATIYAGGDANSNFFLQQINPTLSLNGVIAFDVSQSVVDSSDLVLQVQTGIWGTETGKINLK